MTAITDRAVSKAPPDALQNFGKFLRLELAPRPGRFAYALRIAGLTVLTVFVAEVFRIPEVAYSAYIVFFISKEETASTLLTGAVVLMAATLSILATLAIYALSAGEPGLRIPLMAASVFLGMFASRISPLGPAGFAVGFLVTTLLTLIDVIPGDGPLPSGELLTQAVLWMWVVVALPLGLVVGYNIWLSKIKAPVAELSKKPAGEKRHLLVSDAFSNPDYGRYALKATLAVLTAYFIYTMLNWPDIRTSMITCFFVSLGSYGESAHKMTLRLTGALIGGGMGLLSVIFLMPYLTDIGQLCVLIGFWAFLCAWVAASSEWLAYAGLQMAMAFFLTTLVGFGPTIELSQARDRFVGILLGNIIVFVIFSTLWPINVLREAQKSLSVALGDLSDAVLSRDAKAKLSFHAMLKQARRYIAFDPFEPLKPEAKPLLDAATIDAVEDLGNEATRADLRPADRDHLCLWLKKAALYLDQRAPTLLPPFPVLGDKDPADYDLTKRGAKVEGALKTREGIV